MIKKSLLLTLLMALMVPWAAKAQTTVLSENFDSMSTISTSYSATDWYAYNAGSGNNWSLNTSSGYAHSGSNSACYNYNSYNDANCYLVSAPFTVSAKMDELSVSVYEAVRSSSYAETFEVFFVKASDITDAASVATATQYSVIASASYNNATFAEVTGSNSNSALAGQSVRIVVHCTSAANMWTLYIDDITVTETLAESCPKPKNLEATNITNESATLTWTTSEAPSNGYNIRYRTGEIANPTFFDDFESSLSQWTTLANDYDGSGTNWRQFNVDGFNSPSLTNHSGSYVAMSRSYDGSDHSVDNWLITPQVALDGTLKFWAINDDGAGYPEHYSIYVSTTGNDVTDFTEIYVPADCTEWTEYSIDLSSYSGALGYIAIRHIDEAKDFLFIDDFGIYGDSTPAGSWVNTTSNTNSKDINGLTENTLYEFEVQSNCGGETSTWAASTFTTNPSCMPVADLDVSDVTTTTISLTWTDQNSGSASYIITDGDDNPVTVTNLTVTGCTVTGLTANTAYTFKVTADCGSTTETIDVRTDCDALSTLPYQEGFETSSVNFYCWDLDGFGRLNNSTYAHDGTCSLFSQNSALAYAILPATTTNISDLMLNFWWYNYYSGYDSGSLAVGYLTDETDYSTFVTVGTIDMSNSSDTYTKSDDFLFTGAPAGARIALKYTEGSDLALVIIDDVTVDVAPSCMKPTNLEVTGGLNAVVSWTGSAASYDIAFSDDPTVDPGKVIVGNSTTNSFNLYEAVTLVEGDYTVWVRGNCGGSYSTWASTTLSLSYCTPNPTSHDGKGITGVSFGTGSYVVNNGDGSASLPASSPYYGNYSSMIGAIPAGVPSTIAITTGTGSFPYTFVIWVDLDNDFTFEDSEILYVGKASSGDGTLNAEITIPGTQTLGDYRMRIYGADSYFTSFYNSGTPDYTKPHDPCADGTWRHANDYTVRVTEAPSCLAPTGLYADNITSESADLSWTANSGETSWNIFYKKTSETDYTELKKVTDNPYQLTGLDAATDYEYYVVANCSSTETSDPSAVYYFTTKCDLITTLPWSEDFESYSTGNFNETCWVNEHIAGSATYVFQVSSTTLGTNNTKKLQLPDENDGNMIKLVLPGMTLPNSNYAFFIDVYRSSNYSSYTTEGIRVFASTNGEIEGATELAFIPRVYSVASGIIPAETTADSWYTYTLPINMSGTCYIILRGESKYGASTYMDNFMVASCYPVGTLSYDNLASQTVDLHWTLVDATQDAWQVCINGDETNPVEITATDVTISGNAVTYSLSGFTAETDYTVKVRANCGGGDFGKWSNTVSFTTLAACATPTGLAANNLTQNGANLAWTGSSDVDYYTVQYRTAAGNDGSMLNENFNSLTTAGTIPTNWNNDEGTTTSTNYKWCHNDKTSGNGNPNGTSHDGSNCVVFNSYMNGNGNTNFLKTPSMDFPTGKTMQLTFWWKNPTGGDFSVYISTDGGTTKTPLKEGMTGQSTWKQEAINLTDYIGASNVTIHFKGTSNYGSGDAYIYLDDVVIGEVLTAGTWQTAANDVTAWNYELAGLTASVKYDARVYANCTSDPETENSMTTFTTLADGNIVFPDEGNWAAGNFEPTGAPTVTDDVIIRANVIVPNGTNAYANNITFEGTSVITIAAGASLTINGTVTNGGNDKIIIEDGGQLIHEKGLNATLHKTVTAYTAKDGDGWYLITTPVSSTATSVVAQGTYDLFKYNEPAAYWYSSTGTTSPFSYLYRNTGYLYANAANQTLNFAGSMQATNTAVTMNLSYTSSLSADVRGFNLVGNPFTRNLVKGDVKWGTETNIAYLTMNDTRTDFVAVNINDRPILVGEGFFFQATDAGQTLVFNAPSSKSDNGYIRIVAGNENGSDNAYINVANGNTLHKFNIANGTKVYVLNGGEAYSAARIEELAGSMPVNFKAAADGEYTITINAMNLEANMMILLDKFTGAEIDLLESPTYNFKATTTDDENRFKIIFDCNYTGLDENYADATFVFQSDNDLIVHGEGMLNIYDVLGRLVASYQVNGNKRLSVSTFNTGVYIFKLIGENAQTQKIVVR